MTDQTFFAANGYVNLGKVLTDDEVGHFLGLFDEDRRRCPNFWRPYGYHQVANYDPLVSSPDIDDLIRHPRLLPRIEELMGGPVCFSEIGLRLMPAYQGALHQQWHRDRPHWLDHPLRMDYIQLMVYLSEVDGDTHCFSLSPESLIDPVLEDKEAQLTRGGQYHLQGPAGTCALFNVAVLHTATARTWPMTQPSPPPSGATTPTRRPAPSTECSMSAPACGWPPFPVLGRRVPDASALESLSFPTPHRSTFDRPARCALSGAASVA